MILLLSSFSNTVKSQGDGCYYKDTLFHFDFGSAVKQDEFSLSSLKFYRRSYGSCPDDGYFSFIPSTSNCFNGDWVTLNNDHTAGDQLGKMMLVNSSYKPGTFFTVKLNGFKPNTTYEFSTWLINVCRPNGGCPPLPPNLRITIETQKGKKIADFSTGIIAQFENPFWKRYGGIFTVPENAGMLVLSMKNTTNGGCGNDFAMDDIVFRECYPPPPPPPPVASKQVPVTVIKTPVETKTAAPAPEPDLKLNRKKINPEKQPAIAKPAGPATISVKAPHKTSVVPPALLKRKNLLAEKIITPDATLLLELYDNGVIDGDTVSIYHNNVLVISKAALSATALKLNISISRETPYHEIIMVAENLGSIPPNTSLMVVTGNNKRQEVFISSSEQNNAKIIIERKE